MRAPFFVTLKKSRVPAQEIHTAEYYAASFQNGEEKGFEYFFTSLYPALCLFAARLTGDRETGKDIASAAIIKTWKKHVQLRTPGQIKAYLYQVARHDCYKYLQQQERKLAREKQAGALAPGAQQSHLYAMIEAELMRQLYTHIQELPEGSRKVFDLLYVDGKSVSETAEELNLHISTVKTQKQRAISFLRKRLSVDPG
jgi:RNA polymerase sigma-70 factor (ECF subfamily)